MRLELHNLNVTTYFIADYNYFSHPSGKIASVKSDLMERECCFWVPNFDREDFNAVFASRIGPF